MSEQPPPRRARHLIDPSRPRPAQPAKPARMDVERVKKWVLSILAATTILHLSWGLVISSLFMDVDKRVNAVGLNVIAGVFGIGAFAAALVIHGRKPLHPLLLLGVVPSVVGIWLVYR